MKLVDFDNPLLVVTLPSLSWVDEFAWSPVETNVSYGVGGAIIIQRGTRQAGRTITLESPDQEMGWIYRADLQTLYDWSALSTKKMVLHLEKASDTRTFNVVFAPDTPVSAKSVNAWKDHLSTEPYTVKIKLIEV